MNELFEKFLSIFDALNKEKVEYVLVGGFAVVIYGLPRLTQDIDLFIRGTAGNVDKMRRAFKSIFDDSGIDDITISMLEEYPVVRYASPEGLLVDIIIRLGDRFTFDDLKFVEREIEGRNIRIASVETLYEMKKDTVRPVDKSDSLFLYKLLNKGDD